MAAKKKSTAKKAKPQKRGFDNAWEEYNVSLSRWKESLAMWQEATNDALVKYHDACQKALGTDTELLKRVTSSWEKTWAEIGPEYLKQQRALFENIFKETNLDTMKKFNEEWERFLKTSGDDAIRSYQEAMRKFNATWNTGKTAEST